MSLNVYARTLVWISLLQCCSFVAGFWRLPCQRGAALVVQRADPLTNPGAVSGHVHTISGGSGFNLDMSFEDARASKCTSCQVKQDLSNYWTPALYFAHANGSFTLVDQGGLLIYYLPHRNAADAGPVQAFPNGFRMLAGNPYKRSFDGSEMATAIGINCIGGKKKPTKTHEFPTENCPDALRMEIMFPSCWDGKNLDSANHQTHVAWPSGGEQGPCPATHPVRIESLFYEVWWTTAPWRDRWREAKNSSQPFVLSTGDPTGYSLHGDFLNGWDRKVLQRAIDECTAESGVIEECKVFDLYDYDDPQNQCLQSPAVDEPTTGTLDALPGCNPIDYGPDDVTVCREKSPPSLRKEIVISGTLAGGDHSVKVAMSRSATSSQDEEKTSGIDGLRDSASSTASTQPSSTVRSSASSRPQADSNVGTAASSTPDSALSTPNAGTTTSTSQGITGSPWFWVAIATATSCLILLVAALARRRGFSSKAASLSKGAAARPMRPYFEADESSADASDYADDKWSADRRDGRYHDS